MKIFYQSTDGVIFTTQKECEDHENEVLFKQIAAGDSFKNDNEEISLIQLPNGKFMFGGRHNNKFILFSDFTNSEKSPISECGLTRQEMGNYLKCCYKKV